MSQRPHLATRPDLVCKVGLPLARLLDQQLWLRLAQVLPHWQAHLLLMGLACKLATGKTTEARRYYVNASECVLPNAALCVTSNLHDI